MNSRAERLSRMSPAKLELLARELERLQSQSNRLVEPIAVIGIGCRFPGGTNDSDGFWSLLKSGRDVRTRPPADRGWGQSDGLGYFVDDVYRFDAELFGVSPREARSMDPQQRMLLEVAWHAIEDAGYSPRGLSALRTGIYVGIYGDDFAQQLTWSGDIESVDAHTSTGTSHAAAVGRVSHLLGLSGPAIALDTACSSSLVCVHLACEALRRGECELALVGGVSLALSAIMPYTLSRARMLAGDGRSKTFDASADGYGRGEGCGLVVLRRLSEAKQKQDRILAVIRGTAINHDGRASSLTAPNGAAQTDVILRAQAAAGISAAEIDAIECHGTGTPLGDPVEVRAIREVFANQSRGDRRLWLSAVKSNIGHLEAAAGIAGLIKMVLALHAHEMPGSLHVETLNPELLDDQSWMEVVTKHRTWESTRPLRAAGVSSFGFSGTNAHVVLEQAPDVQRLEVAEPQTGNVITLSAATEDGLRTLARDLLLLMESDAKPALADVCFTANVGRTRHRVRATLDASSEAAARSALTALIANGTDTGIRYGTAPAAPPSCVFMFTGQGSQFVGMGRQLFETIPTFQRELKRCEEMLAPFMDISLTDLLYGSHGHLLSNTKYAQPALFAFEYALAQVWIELGVTPDAVIGHSVGEYVAALLAGVFDLQTGLRLIAERARLMGTLPSGGAMVAVRGELSRLQEWCQGGELELAALNGPSHAVLSGSVTGVQQFENWAKENGIRAQRLDVSHAFHSAHMDPVLKPYGRFVSSQALSRSGIPLYSNLSGIPADATIATAEYWVEHLRKPVRFAAGLSRAEQDGYSLFLEIGPSSTLAALGQRVVAPATKMVASLGNRHSDLACMTTAAAELFVAGASVDWSQLQAVLGGRRCKFPLYPFGGREYRSPSALRGEHRIADAIHRPERAATLGQRRVVAGTQIVTYDRPIAAVESEEVSDHRLFDNVVVPGAFYVATALSAAATEWRSKVLELEDGQFHSPLVLGDGDERILQLVCAKTSGSIALDAFSAPRATQEYVRHAHMNIRPREDALTAQPVSAEGDLMNDFYLLMAQRGFGLGPRFQWLNSVRCRRGTASAQLMPPVESRRPVIEQSGFWDSCFQLLAAAGRHLAEKDDTSLFVPAAFDSIRVLNARMALPLLTRATIDSSRTTDDTIVGEIDVVDSAGNGCVTVRGLCARRVAKAAIEQQQQKTKAAVLRTDWCQIVCGPVGNPGYTAVIGASVGEKRDLDQAFQRLGASVVYCEPSEVDSFRDLERILLVVPRGSDRAFDSLRASIVTLLDLVRRMVERDGRRPRLHVVTRANLHRADCAAPDESSAALIGLVRAMALEYPEIACSLIDVELESPLDMTLLAATQVEGELHVLVRHGEFWVPRLELVSPAAHMPNLTIHATGSYLVTGGLGALGYAVASWLVRRGAGRVVLLGRAVPNDGVREKLESLAHSSTAVEYVAADVGDPVALQGMLLQATNAALPWRGVIHAAGVLDDALMVHQDWQKFERALRPKALGIANLVEQKCIQSVDWWVLFSSLAATLGSPGQANYAYANAWLDSLAQRLARQGSPIVSIAFGPFSGAGMAARQDRLHGSFVAPLSPQDVGAHIEAALASGECNVAIADIDYAALRAVYPSPGYIERCLPSSPRKAESGIRVRLCREDILARPMEEGLTLLKQGLAEALATIVGMPADQLDWRQSLNSVGVDSLTSLEFKDSIERALGVRIEISRLLRGPTIGELAQLVMDELSATAALQAEPMELPEEDLEHLDDRQVEALLKHFMEERQNVAG